MKSRTVDLVVAGDERAALAAAVEAVRRGQRVLVVSAAADASRVSRARRACRATKTASGRLTVMSNAEVVCVDGIDGVEAVVIRHRRIGRLAARDARRLHKALGNPMATWQDGRVVWVQPEDIVVDDEETR